MAEAAAVAVVQLKALTKREQVLAAAALVVTMPFPLLVLQTEAAAVVALVLISQLLMSVLLAVQAIV